MESQKGQTLLIVVLVMVIGLTVSLFLVSRTITNLRNSNEQANSQKAFSAAEAGVEKALQEGLCSSAPCPTFPPVTGSLNNNSASFNTTIESLPSVSSSEFLFNNGDAVAKDDGVDLWLVDHKSDGSLNYSCASGNVNHNWQCVSGSPSLTFYWGSSSNSCTVDTAAVAALELVVLYELNAQTDNGASVKSTRYVYDPCSSRIGQNSFSLSLASGGGTVSNGASSETFNYSALITIPNNSGILVRVVPLYASTPIGVAVTNCPSGQCSLPNQGNLINSTGTSGKTTRVITVFQGYSEIPSEFFPYVLFAPTP